jgi:CMP-N,N'-diacetyllegionaminic acid synthase
VNERVVAIVPARGGSKGLPRKNIRPLAGRPLIDYSIRPALDAPSIGRVIVSTEDEEIAAISRALGAEVPFLRDPDLADDNTSADAAVAWTVDRLFDRNELTAEDIVVLLQPTELFKRADWLEECIACLRTDSAIDVAFLACAEHKNYWIGKDGGGFVPLGYHRGYQNRQVKKPVYREDMGFGSAMRARQWRERRGRLGERNVLLPKEYRLFDIHEEIDLLLAESYLALAASRPDRA